MLCERGFKVEINGFWHIRMICHRDLALQTHGAAESGNAAHPMFEIGRIIQLMTGRIMSKRRGVIRRVTKRGLQLNDILGSCPQRTTCSKTTYIEGKL